MLPSHGVVILTLSEILLEWDSISTSVIDSVTQVKQRRLAAVQAEAERSRTQALRTLYQDVLRKTTGFERAAFPSFNVFLNLPTISSFRTGTTALTTDSWSLALPSIQTEVSGTRRLLKLAYARRLVKGLYAAGHPPPSTFVNALNPSGLSAVVQARTGEVSLTALNLNDPSTLTEQELDDFLDRFTSRAFWFSDGNRTRGGYGHKMERFPAIHAFTVPSSSERCAIAGPRASVPWIKVLFALLKSTGIEDGAVAEVDEKFKALGASFECRWGSCSSRGRLTFSELVSFRAQLSPYLHFSPRIAGYSSLYTFSKGSTRDSSTLIGERERSPSKTLFTFLTLSRSRHVRLLGWILVCYASLFFLLPTVCLLTLLLAAVRHSDLVLRPIALRIASSSLPPTTRNLYLTLPRHLTLEITIA